MAYNRDEMMKLLNIRDRQLKKLTKELLTVNVHYYYDEKRRQHYNEEALTILKNRKTIKKEKLL